MPEELDEKPFLDHLEDLRTCIIRAGVGLAAIYAACVWLALPLWDWVQQPLLRVLQQTGAKEVAIDVGEEWSILYLWTPLLAALFLSAPWLAYQAWRFVSPGLYKRERRRTISFLIAFALLFVAGGLFGYYVLLPSSLVFLLGLGKPLAIERFVRIDSYFTAFVNVTLGSAIAFEAPVAVLFLTMLRIVTPQFLLRHLRYAVLAIAIVAAVVTPSPNPFDMAMVAVPLLTLFIAGVLASFLLVHWREGRGMFRWRR
jgi:sec-independent protein translocase protein TatC